MDTEKLSRDDLKKYGREVKILERLNLMLVILIFWFLSRIRVTGVSPKLFELLGGVGRLKFEFPESVKEIIHAKNCSGGIKP